MNETLTATNGQANPSALLLDVFEVAALLHLSRSTIFGLMKAGRFPAPIRYSARLLRWRRSDIEAWTAQGRTVVEGDAREDEMKRGGPV